MAGSAKTNRKLSKTNELPENGFVFTNDFYAQFVHNSAQPAVASASLHGTKRHVYSTSPYVKISVGSFPFF
jgi:hypothetical protein